MNREPVTEAEIIDVLLGGADPALESRVRQAVRHDMQIAALYAQWSQSLPAIQRPAEALRRMNDRVRDSVMRRLEEEPLGGTQYFISEVTLDETLTGRRPRWLRMRVIAVGVAALLVAAVGGPMLWQWLTPTLVAQAVCGEVTASREDGGAAVRLKAGDRIALPTRLRAAAGTRAEIRLADHSKLELSGAAELVVEGRRRVRQVSGTAEYRVEPRLLERNFSVGVPQGAVEDLGTAFNVRVTRNDSSVVRVQTGRVRVSPAGGRGVEARAGERALLDRAEATVEPMPAWTDLAQARAQFKSHLVHGGPAPQPFTPGVAPPGAREITYASGGLTLKAWLAEPAADGGKHPAVVFLHDGQALGARDWEATLPYRQAGFAVLAPMLRGENGNPGEFEMFWGEVDDVVAAGQAAAALPGVDPRRLCVAGVGTGGTLALLAAMLPSPYAAAAPIGAYADTAPLCDGEKFAPPFDTKDPRERLLRQPAAFPDSLRLPLRAYYGEADREAAEGGRKLIRDAARLGKECRLETVKGGSGAAAAAGIAQSAEFFKSIAP